MWKTFVNGRKLQNTYRVNKFINMLRSLPFVGKRIPYQAYGNSVFKSIGMVWALLNEVFSFFLPELLYVGLLLILPACALVLLILEGTVQEAGTLIFQMFIPLTLIGGLIRSELFDPSEDKYYSIVLMRMHAKEHALSEFLYDLLKSGIGFLIVLSITGLIFHMPAWKAPLAVCYWVAVKVCGARLSMHIERADIRFDQKRNKIKKRTARPLSYWLGAKVLLAIGLVVAAYGPLGWGLVIDESSFLMPEQVLTVFMLIFLLPAVLCAVQLCRAEDYQKLYKRVLSTERCFPVENANLELQRKAARESIEIECEEDVLQEERTRFGFAYFHALFVKRHSKLLKKRARNISLLLIAVAVIVLGILFLTREEDESLECLWMIRLLPFALYFINTGDSLTQAMFVNCDQSMLTYNFYRKREVLLGMFRQRLKTLIRINLMPAGVIAVLLGGVELLFGAGVMEERIVPAIVLIVSTLALSLFFSVHRLVMYYLLQPYNEVMEIKNPVYKVVSGITYSVCYFVSQWNSGMEEMISPYVFAAFIIGFCILYVPIALVLVYRFAPKTFRVR